MRRPTETVKWFIRERPYYGCIVDYAQRSDGTWFTRSHAWEGERLVPQRWGMLNSSLEWISGEMMDATVRLPADCLFGRPQVQRWIHDRIPADPGQNYYVTP
jgi:hypothetical protein